MIKPNAAPDSLGFFLTGQPVILPQQAIQPVPEVSAPPIQVELQAPPPTLGLTRSIEEAKPPGPVIARPIEPPSQTRELPQVAAEAKAIASGARGEPAAVQTKAEQLLKEGLTFFEAGDFQLAVVDFERVEALAPESPAVETALYRRADAIYELHVASGFPPFDQVEVAYQKALGAFPNSPDAPRALLRMGLVNYRVGNFDKAKGYFNLVVEGHPKSPEAITAKVFQARRLLDEGRLQPAIRLLREVVFEHPKSPLLKEALWYLGRALFEVGRYVEAHERLIALQERWPDFHLQEPMILYYIGEASFRLDRLDEARKYLYWVLNINPDVPGPDLILARIGDTYKLQKNYKKAVTIYSEVGHRFPDSDGALIAKLRLAETESQAGEQAEKLARVFDIEVAKDAVATYKAVAKKYADRPVAQLAMLKLGAWHYYQKEYGQAFDILLDLLERYPRSEFHRDALFALRQAFDKRIKSLAEDRKALPLIEFYETYKDRIPAQLRAQYAPLLGQAYLDLHLYAKAASLYEESFKQGRREPDIMLGLGLAYYHEDLYQQATEALARFLDLYPAHGQANEALYLKGKSLLKLKRFAEAAKELEKVARRQPDSPEYWSVVSDWAKALAGDGRLSEAVALLKANLAQAPAEMETRRPLLVQLSQDLMELKKYGEVIKTLEAAVAGLPVPGEAVGLYYRLGEAYFRAGHLDQARQIWDKVAQVDDPFWKKLASDRLVVADVSAQLAAREEVEKP